MSARNGSGKGNTCGGTKAKGGGTFLEAVKMGFGFGLAQIVIGVIGLLFLLPGLYLIATQLKIKEPEKRDKSRLWGGVALAAVGAVMTGGGWLFVGEGVFAAVGDE